MQTRKHSAYEALANLVVGFILNSTVNAFFIHLAGVELHKAFGVATFVAVLFAALSTGRSYVIRRIFNRIAINEHIKERMLGGGSEQR